MSREKEENKWPQKPGWYWGRSGSHQWWNLVVHVEGDVPFLHALAWNYSLNEGIFKIKNLGEITWGPEISYPEKEPEKE